MEVSKTKSSFYRRLYVAWLIDSQTASSVPALTEVTGMPRRTAQDTIAALADLTLYLQATSRFNATSDSTIHAIIEALCAAVARHAKNSVKSAAAMTEFVLPWLHQQGKPE